MSISIIKYDKFEFTKRTMYEFKQRHPNNPAPTNHDQPRN